MPTYDYVCKNCEITFEYEQKMSDNKLSECPYCCQANEEVFYRLVGSPFFFVYQENNVMSIAEKNSREIGWSELRERSEKKKEQKRKALEEMSSKVGGKLRKKSDALPFWRDGKTPGTVQSTKPIDVSKISNIARYIETGEK